MSWPMSTVPGIETHGCTLVNVSLKVKRRNITWQTSSKPRGPNAPTTSTSKEIDTGSDALSYIAKDTLTTSVRESIKINGGHVLQANLIADNGIMHVIDKVLVPQFTML